MLPLSPALRPLPLAGKSTEGGLPICCNSSCLSARPSDSPLLLIASASWVDQRDSRCFRDALRQLARRSTQVRANLGLGFRQSSVLHPLPRPVFCPRVPIRHHRRQPNIPNPVYGLNISTPLASPHTLWSSAHLQLL
ncbi:hypothetical protein NMY22_g3286 [Coprinellus aureogranulatus]|nr:hypothetical protein NMY22_g3286 [Coprinellus aureogranulatus]